MGKSFSEKMKEIKDSAVKKSKDGKIKAMYSQKAFNEVTNALVNDPNYSITTVKMKNGKYTEVVETPVREFREKLLKPLLAELKVDAQDQKSMIENYQFTKAQTEGFYGVTAAAIYEYMKMGKTYKFPSTKDFNASIKLREMPASKYESNRVDAKTGKKVAVKVKRDAYTGLVKKSSCPAWKKHKI